VLKFRLWGSRFIVQTLGCRVLVQGLQNWGLGCIEGARFRFTVEGLSMVDY
jgi:hypothetical protein